MQAKAIVHPTQTAIRNQLLLLQNLIDTSSGDTMFVKAITLVFVFFLYGLDRTLSQNHEVWRSSRMVKSACEQEEKYQQTGQFPEPIKDQQTKDYCGWFSKGKPRGDACADIRVHFSSCKDKSAVRQGSVRVINGTDARKLFPSIAYFWTCSGSVINNRWLLTAGHCLCYNAIRPATRVLGLYVVEFVNNGSNPFRIDVKNERDICHENYTRQTRDPRYDIGLSKVSEFEFNEGVQPIVMPPSDDFRYMGPAYFVGYGYVNDTHKAAFVQEVTLPVISTDICQKLFEPDNVTDEVHVCAGAFESGRRTCNGDSGGPLFICQNYQLVQYGLLLGGTENCGDTPRVFMRLSHFADWISKTMTNN